MSNGKGIEAGALTGRPPADVDAAFEAMPKARRDDLLGLRRIILELGEELDVGPLTETLKWGEPAYLTEATKAGTTIRLGLRDDGPAVFFNCNTTLVEGFRADFPDMFRFEGKRALVMTNSDKNAQQALRLCLSRALTYHRDKRRRR